MIFREGSRSIKISHLREELLANRERYLLQDCLSLREGEIEKTLEAVAVSFFFEGWGEKSFEFIHQSILDYLTVDALLTYLEDVVSIFSSTKPGRSCDRMAGDLYFLLGKTTLSVEDHAPFLEDLVHLETKRSGALFNPLRCFLQAAQGHQYLIAHEQGQNPDPLFTEANLLSALVRMVVVIFNTWPDEQQEKEGSKGGYVALFEELRHIYNFITLLEGTIGSENLDLRRVDLNHATMYLKNLRGAHLIRADLSGADLSGAHLREANLSGAHLREAKNFTRRQLATAVINEDTLLPAGVRSNRKASRASDSHEDS